MALFPTPPTKKIIKIPKKKYIKEKILKKHTVIEDGGKLTEGTIFSQLCI